MYKFDTISTGDMQTHLTIRLVLMLVEEAEMQAFLAVLALWPGSSIPKHMSNANALAMLRTRGVSSDNAP